MAARGRGKSASGGALAGIAGWLKIAAFVSVGVVGGYLWRSYYPLALPFESALVADKSSDDVATLQLRELARAANERADREAREREALAARLRDIEKDRHQTELEVGDLQIQSIIKQGGD
ncbi:hypothetical protein GC173_15785 [bacterium]|nr:hypothetical protein [bacterium]